MNVNCNFIFLFKQCISTGIKSLQHLFASTYPSALVTSCTIYSNALTRSNHQGALPSTLFLTLVSSWCVRLSATWQTHSDSLSLPSPFPALLLEDIFSERQYLNHRETYSFLSMQVPNWLWTHTHFWHPINSTHKIQIKLWILGVSISSCFEPVIW